MVTAETAVVLPVLVLVLAAAVSALLVVAAQLRCLDAAREGARAAARGEPAGTVRQLVAEVGPPGAVVGLAPRSGPDVAALEVTVTVTARVRPLGPVPWRLPVSATATGLVEPQGGQGSW